MGVAKGRGAGAIIEANFSALFATIYLRGRRGDLRLLPVDHGLDDQAVLRDGPRQQLPGSRSWQGPPRLHTPVWSCIAVGRIAAIPFWQYSGAGNIAIAATGMIYLSYFLGNIAIMRARLRGWPRPGAVLAGPVGHAGQRRRPALRRGHAGQLRLAPGLL